jgi:hypothetical protein
MLLPHLACSYLSSQNYNHWILHQYHFQEASIWKLRTVTLILTGSHLEKQAAYDWPAQSIASETQTSITHFIAILWQLKFQSTFTGPWKVTKESMSGCISIFAKLWHRTVWPQVLQLYLQVLYFWEDIDDVYTFLPKDLMEIIRKSIRWWEDAINIDVCRICIIWVWCMIYVTLWRQPLYEYFSC